MKKLFLLLMLAAILLLDFNPIFASTNISGKVCNATTKVCISNVKNKLTVKDETLLQACQTCCDAPNLLSITGCGNRCKKKCQTEYNKAIAKTK